jgi:hypothetical protein
MSLEVTQAHAERFGGLTLVSGAAGRRVVLA